MVREVLKRWSTDQLITGIEIGDWVKMLAENEYRVSPTYYHRAAWVGALSLPATVLGRIEDARFGKQLAVQEINPTPLFILGHWRSGTTHLHNLIGRLPGHTYPTVFQAVFPNCFLTAESFIPQLTSRFMDDTRTYDNVKHGWYEAAEDEIALAKLTGMSPYISFMFPENASKYERYIDFLECKDSEKQVWKDAFKLLLKKIMLQNGGDRVIVKSCTHTARIRMLLEMFPDAKFIHIHRHPYEVYASTLHMRSHTDWENFFSLPENDPEKVRKQQTLLLGERLYERVIEDRRLIPKENFIELSYNELVGNEMKVVENVYSQFNLPGWAAAEPVLKRYVDGLKGYKRNKLKLDKRSRKQVVTYWKRAFEEFGYSEDYDL